MSIIQKRLRNQYLVGRKFSEPREVVGWLGAIQAQDYLAAKWAIALRLKKSTDGDIEREFNDGAILRTHVLRPTWHFVLPEDIRWMLELSAPRIKKVLAHYDRRLGITAKLLYRCKSIFLKVLAGKKYLTRRELAQCLEKNKISARGQKLAHIIMHAELDALLCSGPRKEKQFTYALLEERVPKVKKLTRSEALEQLAIKYFRSHGPAQLKDFSWWSGLSMKDASFALELVGSKIQKEFLNGKTYWFLKSKKVTAPKLLSAFLLSIYDEYAIAYRDRGDISQNRDIERMISMGNALTAVMILNGKVVGSWKKVVKNKSIEIKIKPFRKLSKNELGAFHLEVARYKDFLSNPAF